MKKSQKRFNSIIAAGLQRRSVSKASKWAVAYRVMGKPHPGPWSFERYSWLEQCHDDEAEVVAWQKAAQMGVSESAINKALFALDILKESVLYLLPNSKPDASDFSVGRFDPALEASPHIKSMFTETQNIGMKKAGSAILYIRGSRSDSQLKSIPTGRIFYDEYDEMAPSVRSMAAERASGQESKQEYLLSTPTIPGKGINAIFKDGDQKVLFFRCPRCGQWEDLTFTSLDEPGSLVITAEAHNDPSVADSHLICKKTKLALPPDKRIMLARDNIIWVPQNTTPTSISSYHINQLYSNAAASGPAAFAKSALESLTDPFVAQEFAKNKRGVPYVESGSQITDQEIREALGSYISQSYAPAGNLITLGVDIGTRIHYEITSYTLTNGTSIDMNLNTIARVLRSGYVGQFEELDHFMYAFNIVMAVVDAQPEKRKAVEFAQRFPGRVRVNYYIEGLSNTTPIKEQSDDSYALKVDRTFWMDTALGRFHNRTITLPADTSEEYKDHIKAPVRRYGRDAGNNVVARYVNAGGADHLAHARTYNEIALRLAVGHGQSQSI